MAEKPKRVDNNEKKRKPSPDLIDSLNSPSIEDIYIQTCEMVFQELENIKNSTEEE